MAVNGQKRKKQSFHIFVTAPHEIEIIVKPIEENGQEICEIYGDRITGLTISQLERVLRENPTRRFVPNPV